MSDIALRYILVMHPGPQGLPSAAYGRVLPHEYSTILDMHIIVVESVECSKGTIIIIWMTEQRDRRNKHISCVLKAQRFTVFPLVSLNS